MKIKDNSYIKAILTLVSGSMLGQVITIICSPIITRLFSAEELGIYALVTTAITMFGSIMSFRYEICIVSEKTESKIYPLLKLSLIICAAVSVVVLIGYYIYFSLRSLTDHPIILAFITGTLVFLMGIINIVTAYNNRYREYKLITKTYLQRTISQNVCNIAAGFLKIGAVGLSLSQVIGYSAGVRGQSKKLWKKRKEVLEANSNEVKLAFTENRNQALFSMPATLFNGLSYSMISFFIENLFSAAIVGYYSISYRILGLPMTIVSTNVSRVFLERASNEYSKCGNFTKTYFQTVFASLAMAVPMGICLELLSPIVCEIFFGTGWSVAGKYIQVLTPMFMLRFIAGCINNSAIIAGRQYLDLIIQVVLFTLAIVSFALASIFGFSIYEFLGIINLTFSVAYIIYIISFGFCARG